MSELKRFIGEVHRRSLWQVLGVYLVGSWVTWQVVGSLYEWIGLPDWVPGTALVLLLIGLPIVLATAIVQEGAPGLGAGDRGVMDGLETTTDAVTPDRRARAGDPAHAEGSIAPGPNQGFFTWGKAITGGVLAFAALGLATTGFMGMRAMGIGPAATLVSSGVLEEREPLLLGDFTSASGDSVLATAVTEALRVDLEASRIVTLVPTSLVQDALGRMHREPGTSLTEPVALELAVREGLRAVLVGDVTAAGGQVVLTARLIGPDGSPLASVRQTAAPDAVIQGADRLSAALRERLGESLRSIRSAEPLAQVTTPSLEALRKYSQGVRAYDSEPNTRKAIVLLQEAIEQDSAFAMAWRKLGVAYQFVDEDSMRLALTQAFHHRDRLSERERRLTEGTYFPMVLSDTARAIVAYEALLERHPDEPTALNNLAMLKSAQGDHEGAAELYTRAIETSGTPTARRNQAYVLTRLKRYDEVEQLLIDYEERFPDHFQGPQFRGALAAHRFDYAAARGYFERAREMNERVGGFALASMLMIEGKHAAALRQIRDDRADAPQEELESELEFTAAFMDVFHRFDPGAARNRIERFATEERLQAMPVEARPYIVLGIVNLLAGETARAERWVERWRTEQPEDFDPPEGPAREITLEIAAARGEPDRLIRDYQRQAADGCHPCWFHLGRAYEGAAMPDSAVVAYETYLDPPRPPLFRVNTDRLFLPAALQRAAALHEDAGRTAEAAPHYTRFIALWKDADPELQPQVDAARRALARMTAERPEG